MRLYLLGGLLCICILQCQANPIQTITADDHGGTLNDKAIQTEGEMQEETTGVFKNDVSESPMQSENKQPDMKEESNSVDNSQQAISSSTESNEISMASSEKKDSEPGMVIKPKTKKGKVSQFLQFTTVF